MPLRHPDLDAALDKGVNVLPAYADWLREQGDRLGADCLEWAVATGRWPGMVGWLGRDQGGGPRKLPPNLWRPTYDAFAYDDFSLSSTADSFCRLRIGWATLTDDQREEVSCTASSS